MKFYFSCIENYANYLGKTWINNEKRQKCKINQLHFFMFEMYIKKKEKKKKYIYTKENKINKFIWNII